MVAERAPNLTLCNDALHVMQWATDALDEVRRPGWNEARRGGMSGHANELKGCRYALWRNPAPLRHPRRSSRRSLRRLWRRMTPSPNHTSAPKTAVTTVYNHNGQVKCQTKK